MRKNGGLGLVDLEEVKTSLLCKWIVKVMESGEQNLQLMLKYRLAMFNLQKNKNWGTSLDWFMSKQHLGCSGSKAWKYISKA